MNKQNLKNLFYQKYPKHITDIIYQTLDDTQNMFDVYHVIDF